MSQTQNSVRPWGPPPHSHARNHDLPLYDPDRASDRGTSPDAVQTTAYLTDLFGRVAFTLENDALAFLELRDAVAETCPLRGMFHSYSLCSKLLCRFAAINLGIRRDDGNRLGGRAFSIEHLSRRTAPTSDYDSATRGKGSVGIAQKLVWIKRISGLVASHNCGAG